MHIVLLLYLHGREDGMAQACVVGMKDLALTTYAAVGGRKVEKKEGDGKEISMHAQHYTPG